MTRHAQTMRMLEQARPPELSPAPDPDRRQRDLAMAMSQPPATEMTRAAARQAPLVARPGRLALVGGLAAAIAVAVGLTLAAPPAGRGDLNATPTESAPALLLAAAGRMEAGPATTPGRYWLGTSRVGSLQQVGPAADRYRLLVQGEVQLWLSTVPGDPQGLVDRPLGAAPATDADRAAWRRDGSPTQWTIQTGLGKSYVLSASAGPLTSWVGPLPGWSLVTGGESFTTAQLLDLPTTPAALRAFLVRTFNDLHDPLADGGLDSYLYDAGTQILTELPATPAIRGAAYRMLAQLPDVRNLGPLTLPTGGRGQAIARTHQDAEGEYDAILVFNPSTGDTVGTESRMIKAGPVHPWIPPGTVFQYRAVTHAGWTDGTPPPRQIAGIPATSLK